MRDFSFKNALIILIILSSGFILFFYSSIVFQPNQYLFSPSGDGISSYYNSLYHIEHDSSYLNFQGMNYPYGEHITYSLNNPILSNSIKFIQFFIPEINEYTVGILNISMILSFLLTSIFLFLIFEHYKINRILGIASSLAIMVLSPQIFRMQGHLSLSYGFFIPLFLLLLLKSIDSYRKWIWFGLLFIHSAICIFIHPYYAAIFASFLIAFTFFDFFLNPAKIYIKLKFSLIYIIIAILPLFLYKLFLMITDNHLFRTTNPYGFLVFTSEPECIFIPNHPPLKPLIDKLFRIHDQNWEGLAYIGIANILVIVYVIAKLIIGKIKKTSESVSKIIVKDKTQNSMLLASILVLLFSMGLPFVIIPGYVPDIFGFINEFRSPGRFAWIFYYVVSIYIVYFINIKISQLQDRGIFLRQYIIIFVFSMLFVIEAIPVHDEVSKSLMRAPNYFSKENVNFNIKESIDQLKLEEFQAIIPLPFYHRGSENFSKSPTDKVLMLSELLSFKSGLPLLSSYLARTSIIESKKLLQIISPAEYAKPLKDELKSAKAFLLLISREEISSGEKEMINRSVKLIENEYFMLFRMEFDSLFKQESRKKEPDSAFFAKDDFESSPNSITYNGIGAFTGKLSDYHTIYRFCIDSIIAGMTYEISFWMYNCGGNGGQDQVNCIVYLHDESFSGITEWISVVNPAYSEIIDGCWSKVVLKYRLEPGKDKPAKLNVKMKGAERLKQNFAIDELRVKVLHDSNQD